MAWEDLGLISTLNGVGVLLNDKLFEFDMT